MKPEHQSNLQTVRRPPQLGAMVDGEATRFRIWAPNARSVEVVIDGAGSHATAALEEGYFEAVVESAGHGDLYQISLNGENVFPDPASRYQPEGVHGPSMVVDPGRYTWSDAKWRGIPVDELVFYELHVGTFSPEGSFDGVRERLPFLKDLGITAVELMPVADFPGRWNWGYDHAALYAPSRAYGTPDDLRRLVDEAHQMELAVFLDVIYNHLGPDGAYVAAFAPMFTDRHETPWGQAINLDDRHSRGVRDLFIDNALTWLTEYHFDGLRLDATHALVDDTTPHFLQELKETVEGIESGPPRRLVAEDHRNEHRLVLPRTEGGYQLDAVWSDDFHHQVRNLTAGDEDGYYVDFADTSTEELATTMNQGWFYDGRLSKYSGRPRGTDASRVRPQQCVVCIQNHDQVGNRPTGRRLHHDVPLDVYRAASALLLLSPELPLLFMGQEWAATTPFQFFTDHNEELGPKVSKGRKREFESFENFAGDVPDPQDPETFIRSRLHWSDLDAEEHACMMNLYRDLLSLRRQLPPEAAAEAAGPAALQLRRGSLLLIASLGHDVAVRAPGPNKIVLHTEEKKYAVDGAAPTLSDGHVHFPTPAAIVLSTDASG